MLVNNRLINSYLIIVFVIFVCSMLTACDAINEFVSIAESQPSSHQSEEGQATPDEVNQAFLPLVNTSPSPTPYIPKHQLAFLNAGDIWLVDIARNEPKRLTEQSDVISFVWSHDGDSLAFFNGYRICFINLNPNKQVLPCVELGFNQEQASIHREMAWSPDEQYMVLWNTENPWNQDALGWVIIPLSNAQQIRIVDPFKWMEGSPEYEFPAQTGQPLFLPDGTLLGTITWICGSGGCHYDLQQFDLNTQKFKPFYPETIGNLSEGMDIAMTPDGRCLASHSTFHVGCAHYTAHYEMYDLIFAHIEAVSIAF
jgi:hypothetical protein